MKKILEIFIGGLLLFFSVSFLKIFYSIVFASDGSWFREFGYPMVFFKHTVVGEFIQIEGVTREGLNMENLGIDIGIYVVAFLILKLGWDKLWK